MGNVHRLSLVAEDGPRGNEGPSAAYSNGVLDGSSARANGSKITIYLEVGIDDYARGFRAGFFGSQAEERFKDMVARPDRVEHLDRIGSGMSGVEPR